MKISYHIDPEEVDRESAKLYAAARRTVRDEIQRKDALVLAQMRADQALEMARASGRTYKDCLDSMLHEEAIRLQQARNASFGAGNDLGDFLSMIVAVFASFWVGVIVLAVTYTVSARVALYVGIDLNLPVTWLPCACIAGVAALFVLIRVFMKVSRFLR